MERRCPPDPINNLRSLTGKLISEKNFSCRSVQISKILFRRFYSSGSDPPQDHAVLVLLFNLVGVFISPDHHGRVEIFCTTVVPAPKEHLRGTSPSIFYMIHRGGRNEISRRNFETIFFMYVHVHIVKPKSEIKFVQQSQTFRHMYMYMYVHMYIYTQIYIYTQ